MTLAIIKATVFGILSLCSLFGFWPVPLCCPWGLGVCSGGLAESQGSALCLGHGGGCGQEEEDPWGKEQLTTGWHCVVGVRWQVAAPSDEVSSPVSNLAKLPDPVLV